MIKSTIQLMLTTAVSIAVLTAAAAAQPAPNSPDPLKKDPPELFDREDILKLELSMDIKKIRRDVKKKRSYHPAVLTYKDDSGQPVTLNLKVRARGVFRRDPRICDFPPLMLNFRDKDIKGSIFRGQNKIKMVTHCKRRINYFDEFVAHEYLVYKLYSLFSDKSFRVRLAEITYVNPAVKGAGHTRLGFFIEDDKKMAKRLGCKRIQNRWGYHLMAKMPIRDQLILDLFQFMIGNTDWSSPLEHNVQLMLHNEYQTIYAVPYDFDITGIVNPYYATPDPKLRIKSVRKRQYRGFCSNLGKLDEVIAIFKSKKSDLYALYENFPHLKGKYKKSARRYLDEFFQIISDPSRLKKQVIDNCRKVSH